MKILILTFILVVSAFAKEPSQKDLVQKGIDLLYENVDSSFKVDREDLVNKAISLKERYDEIVKNYQFKDLKIENKNITLSEFQFSSGVQNYSSKSNTVFGYIYKPNIPAGCNLKFPATIFVHHVADDISDEKLLSSLAAKMKKGIVMLIFLPDYGPRKDVPSAPPFRSDLNEFKEKLFQSLVDIRIAGNLLSQLENVDTNQLQLGGLSLGAVITAISAGFDPFFKRYLIAMGGGDIARILGMDKSKDTTKNVRDALANINWNMDESRKVLSALDAITWSYNLKNKEIIFVNSKDDELIDNQMSVQKLLYAYRENGNQVQYNQHSGSHVPQPKKLGYKKTLRIYGQVLSAIVNFFGDSKSAEIQQCENPH